MATSGEMKRTSELIVEAILPDVRKGRMVILVDDEDRENEGDLFVAAERASADAINFMATHARGLVSLALTEQRVRERRHVRVGQRPGRDPVGTGQLHPAAA